MTHAVPLLALRRSGARPKASRVWALGVAYSIAVVGAERTRVLERTHTDIR